MPDVALDLHDHALASVFLDSVQENMPEGDDQDMDDNYLHLCVFGLIQAVRRQESKLCLDAAERARCRLKVAADPETCAAAL
jgi:hypothetical protein